MDVDCQRPKKKRQHIYLKKIYIEGDYRVCNDGQMIYKEQNDI
jgi:hypothetical protein